MRDRRAFYCLTKVRQIAIAEFTADRRDMLGPVADVLRLSADEARRVAVAAQLLASPGPLGVADVVAHLGWLQIDPTAVVERTERLVLFSRLGAYDVARARPPAGRP